jgi:hypothetical protein
MDTNRLSTAVTDWAMSVHARIRSQQRGIRATIIGLILHEHDVSIPCGDGCRSISVSRRTLIRLTTEGLSPQLVDKVDGVTLVIDERARAVITVLHQSGRAGRHYRRSRRHRSGGRRSEMHIRRRTSSRRD